jgi:uncharacterized protein YeaO (DUF488 family)
MALYSTYISNIKNLTKEQQDQVLIIARYFKPGKFKKDIRLCPSDELLRAIKSGEIDWDEYEVYFKEEMQKDPMLTALRQLYKRLKSGEDIILVCYEKDYMQCHRRLIGEFLKQFGVEYHELQVAA